MVKVVEADAVIGVSLLYHGSAGAPSRVALSSSVSSKASFLAARKGVARLGKCAWLAMEKLAFEVVALLSCDADRLVAAFAMEVQHMQQRRALIMLR
jgi:tetrahydromethanopterin S-methyltransferase subunit D